VSPDDFLATLPFEVIQKPDGRFLIEELGFVYIRDPSSLVKIAKTVRAPKPGLLVVGGVDYGRRGAVPADIAKPVAAPKLRSGGRFWNSLDKTIPEAAMIEKLHETFVGARVQRLHLGGEAAIEERAGHLGHRIQLDIAYRFATVALASIRRSRPRMSSRVAACFASPARLVFSSGSLFRS
jgi:hypothetical protein